MGATVVLVCASHSTSHFTLQSQLSELPRRSLIMRVMEGTKRGQALSCSAHPPKPSPPSFSSLYDLPNAGSHTTPSRDVPLCGTVERARTQALQVTQDVQGSKDVSRQCLQVIVGQ